MGIYHNALIFSIILFKLLNVNNATHTTSNNVRLWNWECVNEKCVPSKSFLTDKYVQSLATCNMLCGSVKLWPQPTGPVTLASTAVPVRADLFYLQIAAAPSQIIHDHIRDAFELLREDLHKMEGEVRSFQEWHPVQVRVYVNGSGDPRMRLDTDESYSLRVLPADAALAVEVRAASFCGARHAFETLSQLVWPEPYAGALLALEAATVQDAPRFRYRGLLLDTARNYFPVSELLRTVDAMAASKLNTFHWHASDSEAFSLGLAGAPQLARRGAYGPSAMYSPHDVRAVVRRARLRGVRVLLEIDAPAHVGYAWDWGERAGLGALAHCLETESWASYCGEPPCGQLNPRNPHVYSLLERIYAEIIQLTGVDDIFHIGADEISNACWMKFSNETSATNLWIEFTRKVLQRLQAANGKLPNLTLLWSSTLNNYIKLNISDYAHVIGIQMKSAAWANKNISGLRTVISHEDAWDLNSGLGEYNKNSYGAPYNSWQRVYEHRPWTRSDVALVEGGEATAWSATLSAGGLDARIWPRAAALAERLWTDRAEGATRLVGARLDVHRTRLTMRGIRAAPIWSMWCTQNPYTC